MPLSALLFYGHVLVDFPIEAFALLIALDESIVLSKIMAYTRLPATGRGFELVPGILPLNIVVNLLEIHLASRRRGNRLVDENDIIRCRPLQLFLGIVFHARLW